MKTFRKILIANRGEIASRIIKAAKELNIKTVAIYSEQDASLDFVIDADESVLLIGETITETYLNSGQIIKIAKEYQVDAIHPGYGFLSEISGFAEKCIQNNIVFIGPAPESIRQMGDKLESRKIALEYGLPVLPVTTGEPEKILKLKNKLTYPVLIKASAGGGGKGMKIIYSPEELKEAIWIAKQQAKNYFGDDTIYLERYLKKPKHIEVQVFGDDFGNYVHLFERECSIQRRHQKIIEETPSPTITEDLRNKITSAALELIKRINYKNAGTVEFLVQDNEFYFLEMNTRIQVEHPVTEETTGIDLVKEQISVAAGNPLSFSQEEIQIKNHSIECRIYAEDPKNDFRPSPGKIINNILPKNQFCRIDTICTKNKFTISSDFDPMITKLVTSAASRKEAINKMDRALSEYNIHGIKNNVAYLREIIRKKNFINGKTDTTYINNHHQTLINSIKSQKTKIPKSIPLLGTYLYLFNKKRKHNNIWDTIGRWRAFDIIHGKINGVNNQCKIISLSDNILRIFEEEKVIDLEYVADKNHYVEIINNKKKYRCIISRHKQNTLFEVTVDGFNFIVDRSDLLEDCSQKEYLSKRKDDSSLNNGYIKSPLHGKAIKINYKNGDKVNKGDTVLIIESMKTENKIIAEHDGIISDFSVSEGEQIKGEQLLLRLL